MGPRLIAGLAALLSLALITSTILPYHTFKSLGDSLMSDHLLKSLNENNAIFFKLLLGAAGVVLLLAAYVIGTPKIRSARDWLRQYFIDLNFFFQGFKRIQYVPLRIFTLLVITGMAVMIRLVFINDPMGHDESYTYMVFSSTSIFNITTNYHLPNNHILNSLFIYVSTHLLGNQPWVVRLPAFLAGVLLIPASYSFAKTLYDIDTALFSAILVAVFPGTILYSITGRGYSLVALFTIFIFGLAEYLLRRKNLFAWSLFIFFSVLGFYTIPVMLLPFGCIFTWMFLENWLTNHTAYNSRLHFFKYWLIAGASTAILVLFLYSPVFIYSGLNRVFANQWVLPESKLGYLQSLPGYLLNVLKEWTSGTPAVLTALLITGFALSLVFHRRISRQRFPLPIAVFLWMTLLILALRPERVTKIWAFLAAPFMIWCASGIIGSLKSLRSKYNLNIPAGAILTGIVLAIILGYTIQTVRAIPSRWMEKGAVEQTVISIKEQVGPEDLIIVDSPYDAATWYYSRLQGLSDQLFNKNRPFERLFVIVSRSDGQTLESVLQARGPDQDLIDFGAAHYLLNHQNLDIFLVPHR